MTQSPPDQDVEHAAPSPDNNENENQEGESGMNNPDEPLGELGYDFEVKEQDRWLPIANGKCDPRHSIDLRFCSALVASPPRL